MASQSARPGIHPYARASAAPLGEGRAGQRRWVTRWLLMGALALALALLGGSPARAAEPDPWFGRDKALHFSLSGVISAGGYGAAAIVTEDRDWRLLTGAVLGVAAGAAKETYDATGAGDPSWRDFTWDLLGTATGLGLAYLIDCLIAATRPARPVTP